MARPNFSARTRTRIIDAALALIDDEGMEALSTRRLGRELGMRGPTLYHYFADKNALLDAVRDRIVEEIWTGVAAALADVPPGDWAGTLRGYVDGAVTAMSRHPNAVGFMALRTVTNRRTLLGYESMLERLTACGWSLAFAWQVFMAAENLMLATALERGAPEFTPPPDRTAGLPLVSALVAEAAADPSIDQGYTIGLDALITGISAALAARR